MSDGGAAVIVEVGSMLTRSRAGRVVLVVLLAYAALQYAVASVVAAAPWVFGILGVGLLALGVAFLVRRRRRAQRTSLLQALALGGVVLLAGLVALLLLLRRRKDATLAPPPSPEEVDRLAFQEGA